MRLSRHTVLALALAGGVAQAQEHPYLAYYALTELPGAIRVEWTLLGGSTCDGQEVERSTDGVHFSRVHRIDGLCGDPAVAVPFQWVDPAPPELSTVSYRIKLGFEGYSSVRSVDFLQLVSSEQRFFPSPMGDDATLLLNVPGNAPIDLRVFGPDGRLVRAYTGLQGPALRITLPGAAPGAYSYMAETNGRAFQGRFVKE